MLRAELPLNSETS